MNERADITVARIGILYTEEYIGAGIAGCKTVESSENLFFKHYIVEHNKMGVRGSQGSWS